MLGDQASAPTDGVTVRLSPDGPHSPEYTGQVASAIAEAVRVLNHATLNFTGQALEFPADADTVLCSLGTAAQRLPQLLDQLRGWLNDELAAGRLRVGHGPHTGDPAAAMTEAARKLRDASAIAFRLHLALTAGAEEDPR
jgi:hypothetical protein